MGESSLGRANPDVRNLTPLSGQSKRGQVASLSDNVEGAAVTRWAVVTGAGNGLGAVIGRQAVKAGYRLAAWDIDEQSLSPRPRSSVTTSCPRSST
jgi:hypothetical protein